MDYVGIISLVFGGLTLSGGAITFFVTWGKINQRVDDQATVIADMRDDIDRAAAAALEVKSLASAIEGLTTRVSDGLGHIGELFQQQNEHVKIQLTDIKDELRQVRSAGRSPSPPRERRSN